MDRRDVALPVDELQPDPLAQGRVQTVEAGRHVQRFLAVARDLAAQLRRNWNEDKRWEPSWSEEQRAEGYAGWRKAVTRTLDWVDVE